MVYKTNAKIFLRWLPRNRSASVGEGKNTFPYTMSDFKHRQRGEKNTQQINFEVHSSSWALWLPKGAICFKNTLRREKKRVTTTKKGLCFFFLFYIIVAIICLIMVLCSVHCKYSRRSTAQRFGKQCAAVWCGLGPTPGARPGEVP